MTLMLKATEELRHIDVGKISPDPSQPRKRFVPEEVERMAASLKARGMLQPLRVRHDESRDEYYVITGETRWRAAVIAEFDTVPCLVSDRPLDETDILSDQIIENLIRNALLPMELARGLFKLKSLKNMSAQELAAELGISPSTLSRSEALLSLPLEIQGWIDSGALKESVGYELTKLSDSGAQFEVAHEAMAKRWTREQVVDAIRSSPSRKKKTTAKRKRLGCKHEGISISVSAGQPMTLDAIHRAIDFFRKEAKKLVEAGEASQSAS